MDPWMMGAGIGVQALSGILGGVLGHDDAKEAEALQRMYLEQADSHFAAAADGLVGAQQRGRGFMQEALGMMLALENDALAGYDEVLANSIGRTLRERDAARASTRASMTQRGLGNSTIQDNALRGTDALAEQSVADVASAFAQNRAALQGSFRQAGAGALFDAGQFELQSQGAIAEAQMARGGLFGNVQVQPPNTAANIGAIGSNISNSIFMSQLVDKAFAQE